MLHRIIQALRMEHEPYERAAHDATLNREAVVILLFVTLATTLGELPSIIADGGFVVIVFSGMANLTAIFGGELVVSGLVILIGRVLFGGTATFGGVFRALAYAYSPNMLDILSFIPIAGDAVWWVTGIWSLLLAIVAVREALTIKAGEATITVLLAIVLLALPIGMLAYVGGAG